MWKPDGLCSLPDFSVCEVYRAHLTHSKLVEIEREGGGTEKIEEESHIWMEGNRIV